MLNPLNPSVIVRVLLNRAITRAMIATELIAIGWVIKAIMVAAKIANRCHAFSSTPRGEGISQIVTPEKIGNR